MITKGKIVYILPWLRLVNVVFVALGVTIAVFGWRRLFISLIKWFEFMYQYPKCINVIIVG
nr:hypothetical protein BEI47_14855 [Aliivibrio fischeri]